MKKNILLLITIVSFNFGHAAQPAAATLSLPDQLKLTRHALLKISVAARAERNKVWKEEFDRAVTILAFDNLPKGDTTFENHSTRDGDPQKIAELKAKIAAIESQMKEVGLKVPRLSTPDPIVAGVTDKQLYENHEKYEKI
ncbi:MAG: hypothetical protein P4L31_00595 [Candidatus Babeliales bacterium]|nr:hypothetical protein [Candidatus Babeliales bacterium]